MSLIIIDIVDTNFKWGNVIEKVLCPLIIDCILLNHFINIE